MASIITKRGDDGFTDRLFGGRISKASGLIETIGSLDELNAWIGFSMRESTTLPDTIHSEIENIQKKLVSIMGELSASDEEQYKKTFLFLTEGDITYIEGLVHEKEKKFTDWQKPTNKWDIACRVCRRAERALWRYNNEKIDPAIGGWGVNVRKDILIYINRLGDYLWIVGRMC
jgi:cob(I)alamin adenosyltransferase